MNQYASSDRPRALVVGLGIAGIASALALHGAGWETVIVERAPERRTGGYFMAVFGVGRHAAHDLGMGERLLDHRPDHGVNYEIDRVGNRRPGRSFSDIPINPYLTMRGDVEEAAYATLAEVDDDVDVRFATVPVAIRQDDSGAEADLRGADGAVTSERFDLVVGADGIHSGVRRLVFAADEVALRPLNHMICAYALTEDLPTLEQGTGAMLIEPRRSFHVFPFKDRPSTVLFSYRTDDPAAERRTPVAERLREVYGPEPLGPVLEAALQQMGDGRPVLFDQVEQVELPTWHIGRVVLVGDAAWCPSLYSGMGATSALAGANLLGLRLAAHPGDVPAALDDWERTLRPDIAAFQREGRQNRTVFTPDTKRELYTRALRMKMDKMPFTGRIQNKVLPHLPMIRRRERHLV